VQYDVAIEDIASANDITTTSVLSIGQELVIPGQTPEATVAPSPTETITPSPTATARALLSAASAAAEASRFKYLTPELLSPPSATVFTSTDDALLLSWVSVGILEEDEWYRLRIWTTFGKVEPQIVWTKATSWRFSDALQESGGEYCWQVQVATRTADGEIATQLSEVSAKYMFTWR